MTEQEKTHELMKAMSQGKQMDDLLKFDPVSKTIRPASACRDADTAMVITPSDMEHFIQRGGAR